MTQTSLNRTSINISSNLFCLDQLDEGLSLVNRLESVFNKSRRLTSQHASFKGLIFVFTNGTGTFDAALTGRTRLKEAETMSPMKNEQQKEKNLNVKS